MKKINIETIEKEYDGELVRVLLVDGKEESATYMNDKKYELVYTYSSMVIEEILKQQKHNSVLLLGGGGFSIPKYFISHCKEGSMDVVEKNKEIYDIAHNNFFLSDLINEYDLNLNHRLNTYLKDAIDFLKKTEVKYDVIINDAYDGGEMASELLTSECVELIASHLEKDGVYIINFFSAVEGHKKEVWDKEKQILKDFFSRSEIRRVDESLPKNHRQNCIVVAIK